MADTTWKNYHCVMTVSRSRSEIRNAKTEENKYPRNTRKEAVANEIVVIVESYGHKIWNLPKGCEN